MLLTAANSNLFCASNGMKMPGREPVIVWLITLAVVIACVGFVCFDKGLVLLVAIAAALVIPFILEKPARGLLVVAVWELTWFSTKPMTWSMQRWVLGTIIEVLIICVILAGLSLRCRGMFLKRGVFTIFLLVFLAYIAFLFAFGLIKSNSPLHLFGDLYRLGKIPFLIVIGFVALKDINEASVFVKRVVFIAVCVFSIDILRYHLGLMPVGTVAGYEVQRITTNSQIISMFAFQVAVAIFLCEGRHKLSSFIPVVISSITVLLTFTRTYWMTSLLGLLFILVITMKNRQRRRSSPGIKMAFVLLPLVVLLFFGRIPGYKSGSALRLAMERFLLLEENFKGESGTRISEAHSIIGNALAKPYAFFVGEGLGSKIRTYVVLPNGRPSVRPTHYIHISYLEFFLRGGVIGLVIFLLCMGSYAFYAYQTLSRCRRWPNGALAEKCRMLNVGGLAVLFAMLVSGLANFNFYYSFPYLVMGASCVTFREHLIGRKSLMTTACDR